MYLRAMGLLQRVMYREGLLAGPWSLQSRKAIICPDTVLLDVTRHKVVLVTMTSLMF